MTNDAQYEARFERIENVLETLANGQKQLLTSQVLMADQITKLAAAQVALAEAQARTELRLQETTDKLDALIQVVDDLVRDRHSGGGEGPIQ